jgi:hypothetical protein
MYFDVEAYADALDDLTQNSKPQINTLTMIAEENIKSAKLVVECIDKRLKKVKNIFLKKLGSNSPKVDCFVLGGLNL